MADLDTIRTRIAAIDEILSEGVKSTSVGDMRADYDLESLRKERERLNRALATSSASRFRRIVFKNG